MKRAELQRRIEMLRPLLAEDIAAGQIGEGRRDPPPPALARWTPYADFLAIADGATFGSIDLWSSEDLPENQYQVVDLPGGAERWLIVGQVVYEPLALEADTGELRVFPRYGVVEGQPLGLFESFVLRVLSGEYSELVRDGEEDDEWWAALLKAGLR